MIGDRGREVARTEDPSRDPNFKVRRGQNKEKRPRNQSVTFIRKDTEARGSSRD
jgi:hypothetical protein